MTDEPGARVHTSSQVSVVFDGDVDGAGHHQRHYVEYLETATDPAVIAFLASLGGTVTPLVARQRIPGSAFAVAGAQVLLFTTGVGNSFTGALAPTVKVSANPETVARLPEQIDFDASAAFSGAETMDAVADRLQAMLLEIASGTLTWGELLIEGEEVISRFGPARAANTRREWSGDVSRSAAP